MEEFDVIIIGGGINGTGLARDLSLRGLRPLLLECRDFGSGTTAFSTRLIHGGLRYLEFLDVPLVRESLRERHTLLRIANHLVYPLAFVLPIYDYQTHGRLKLKLGLTLYDLLAGSGDLPRHKMLSSRETLTKIPTLNPKGLHGAFEYYDCQVPLPERLALENILDAEQHGAVCLSYHTVNQIRLTGESFEVHVVNRESGEELSFAARAVFNAAGPWVNEIAGMVDEAKPQLVGGTKGSHLIVENCIGLSNALYSPAKSDGRPFFIVPLSPKQLLIGTTEVFFDQSPERARAGIQEVSYLVSEANELCPELRLRSEEVHLTYSGVRPLPPARGKSAKEITRRHFLAQHKIGGRRSRFISIIGGKITTYRSLAEEAGDLACSLLGCKQRRGGTGTRNLPGAWESHEHARGEIETRTYLSVQARPLSLYGQLGSKVESYAGQRLQWRERLHPDHEEIGAQAAYAAKEEKARHLEDFMLRRTMLGFKTGVDERLAGRVARLLGEVLHWNEERINQEVKEYLGRLKASLAWRWDRAPS